MRKTFIFRSQRRFHPPLRWGLIEVSRIYINKLTLVSIVQVLWGLSTSRYVRHVSQCKLLRMALDNPQECPLNTDLTYVSHWPHMLLSSMTDIGCLPSMSTYSVTWWAQRFHPLSPLSTSSPSQVSVGWIITDLNNCITDCITDLNSVMARGSQPNQLNHQILLATYCRDWLSAICVCHDADELICVCVNDLVNDLLTAWLGDKHTLVVHIAFFIGEDAQLF